MEHTKGDVELIGAPYHVIQGVEDGANSGRIIAEFHGPDAEANARYAATCWNRHERLVNLLTAMLTMHGPRNAEEAKVESETRALLEEIEKGK